MNFKIVLFLLVNFIIFAFCFQSVTQADSFLIHKSRGIEKVEPQLINDVAFYDEKSEDFSLEQFEGKILIVKFWASWCFSCSQELEKFDKYKNILQKQNIELLAVSEDFQGIPKIQEFYKKMSIQNLQILWDAKGRIFNKYFKILPSSMIIDQKGRLVAKISGEFDFQNKAILELLQQLSGQKIDFGENQEEGAVKGYGVKKSNEKEK